MSDRRPTIESALDAFSELGAVVTPPGGTAVETRAFWLSAVTEDYPSGADQRRAEPRRRLVIPLDGVTQLPRGTLVTVPEYRGAVPATWKVDEAERIDHDHYRLVVVPT